MKLARVQYQDKVYYTKFDNDNYYPLDNDYFSYLSISNEPLIGIDRILPPVIPTKIVALGLNYNDHIKEFDDSLTHKEPVIFMKPVSSVIGYKDYIIRPRRSSRVDYEGELAIVIGSQCKKVSRQEAHNYILGYTCLNDVTARDIQSVDGQWIRAKGFDSFCPIGPYVETDLDPSSLEIKTLLNGELKQNVNTSDMIYGVDEIVEFVSNIMTLNEGDIISTGTPSGVGPMLNGDRIEIIIENIGTLINYVRDEE